MIGFVYITKEGNPNIIDATNRQDFVDTLEYRDLKEFILLQLDAFEQFKIFERNKKSSKTTQKMVDASGAVGEISKALEASIAKASPDVAAQLLPLQQVIKKASLSIKSAIKTHQDEEVEHERHESMYMRMMSRHEDAINITHAVKTSMGKIQRQAGFFNDRFPNPILDEYFKLYAVQIYSEMQKLERATDEIFDYAKVNSPAIDINLKELIIYLLNNYKDKFKVEGIDLEVNIEDNLIINGNEIVFYDIIQNITDNAIKAMKNSKVKIYRCSIKAENNKLVMLFSDTGCGIPIEDREWIFGLYNTRTQEMGGGGIGLYTVRMRVKYMNGIVKVVDSEFGNKGVTFRIELPFKEK